MKKIKLYGQYGEGKHALVDDADFENLNKFRWHVLSVGYAARRVYGETPGKGKYVYMHRVITKASTGEVDHVNLDMLDNRQINLRVCSRSENMSNTRKKSTNKSGFKGVSWSKESKAWIASITKNYKQRCIGRFPTREEAALAYNEAAIESFGQFARLNII